MESFNDYPEHIRQELSFHYKLLEAVNDSIIVADINGHIIYWNRGSERLFGLSAAEVIGQPFANYFGENAQEIPTHINEIYQGFWTGKIPVLTRSGEKKYFNVSVSAMNDYSNKPSYLVGIISDVTELMELRIKAEEALRSKEEFLANISHEIRTPMTGILGYVELLGNLPMDELQNEYLESIKESAEQLLELINDILDLAKIDADKVVLEKNVFNVKEIINSVLKVFEPSIQNKGLKVFVEIEPELPEQIISDYIRIKQILSNLLSNAVKFTHKGYIKMHVMKDKQIKKEKFELVIRVVDTGIGIPPSKLPKIFEPFTQADSSTTRKYGGTGLGLSISKKLVEILSGQISVESKEGKGSEFTIRIPVEGITPPTKEPQPHDNNNISSGKLLLISPSPKLFELLSTLLIDLNIKPIWNRDKNHKLSSLISFYEPKIVVIDLVDSTHDIFQHDLGLESYNDLLRIYALTNQSDLITNPSFDQPHIKYVHSLDALIHELESLDLDTFTRAEEIKKNILLFDENSLNTLLMKKILISKNYTVKAVTDFTEFNDIGKTQNFDFVFIDGEVIKKYGNKLYEKLDLLPYSYLIGILNPDDSLRNTLFTDFIYKPVSTENILKVITKYGGKANG